MTKDCTCLNCLHGYRQTLHTMVKASSKIEILEAKAQEGLVKGIYQVCSSLLVYFGKGINRWQRNYLPCWEWQKISNT